MFLLDLDATDDPREAGRAILHGLQTLLYLPLYIFCGEHLLCARLRIEGPPTGWCRN